ncbi:MAG: DUF3572 domain-containing protein [Neomegalonema sp.]|nr:DUF3572 domain-containing protein [Neomegalonema sp.]
MLSKSAASTIGQDALLFLAERPEDLMRFLGIAGGDIDDLRARMMDPDLHGFVLDFIMSEEWLAREFCESHDLTGEKLLMARAVLPGGDNPNWL